MASKKPVIHGRDHLPGGADPIPAVPSSGGAPSVATFWVDSDSGDDPITVAGGAATNIAWQHAELPSDGLITGPFVSDQHIQFNSPCLTIEFLYTIWDGPDYLKAGILGTDDRVGFNDIFALAAAGIGGADGSGRPFGDGTFYPRPNAHIADDLIHAYVRNGDSASHDVNFARLVIFAWAAPGYTGGVPGYPE
jgi:hypothetical protein